MYPSSIIYKIYHTETEEYSVVESEFGDSHVYLYGSRSHGTLFSENSFIPEEHSYFLGRIHIDQFFYYVAIGAYLITEKIEIYKK